MAIMSPALSANGAILKFQPLHSLLIKCIPSPPTQVAGNGFNDNTLGLQKEGGEEKTLLGSTLLVKANVK